MFLGRFGGDYDTVDGTGVRDYIHLVGLARGHVKAVHGNLKGVIAINLGTGSGQSVLQLIKAFEQQNTKQVPYEIVGRRAGDSSMLRKRRASPKYIGLES